MKLIVEDDEGRETAIPIDREQIELSIGRQEDNTVHLPDRNVSRHHARILGDAGRFRIEDLDSSYGVFVNGDRIHGSCELAPGDVIAIGDYHLALVDEAQARPPHREPAPTPLVSRHDPEAGEDNLPTPPMQPATAPLLGANVPTPPMATPALKIESLPAGQAPRFLLAGLPSSREFPCSRTLMRLGRAVDNDIVLDDPTIAPQHARIIRGDSGEWRVVNLQAGDGLKVNGEPHAECALHPGDELELGALRLHFLAAGEDSPPLTVDSAPNKRNPLLTWAVAVGVVAAAAAGYLFIKPQVKPAPAQVASAAPKQAPAPPSAADPAAARASLQTALEALAAGRLLATGENPRCEEATPLLQKVLEYAPELAEAHLHLGRCLARQDQPHAAAEHYEAFVHERPKDPQSPALRQWLREYFKGSQAQPRWSLEEP